MLLCVVVSYLLCRIELFCYAMPKHLRIKPADIVWVGIPVQCGGFVKGNVFPMVREISSYYPIERINEAVADAKSGKNIKTLLVR